LDPHYYLVLAIFPRPLHLAACGYVSGPPTLRSQSIENIGFSGFLPDKPRPDCTELWDEKLFLIENVGLY
jgi:hypothetical protein